MKGLLTVHGVSASSRLAWLTVMANKDATRLPIVSMEEPAATPVVILVAPRLAENIGTTARAMLNTGLSSLRLVRPQVSHLDTRALAAASGAASVLHAATLYTTLPEAIADLHRLYATSVRRRKLVKPVVSPRLAATGLRIASSRGEHCGLLFGPERTGLSNDDIALADVIVEIPLNSVYTSLNLAQAVLILGYEWFQAEYRVITMAELTKNRNRPATRAELLGFFHHLESELVVSGFLRVEEKRPTMVRNIRTLFERANLTAQEVRTLHGIIKELCWGRTYTGSLRWKSGVDAEQNNALPCSFSDLVGQEPYGTQQNSKNS